MDLNVDENVTPEDVISLATTVQQLLPELILLPPSSGAIFFICKKKRINLHHVTAICDFVKGKNLVIKKTPWGREKSGFLISFYIESIWRNVYIQTNKHYYEDDVVITDNIKSITFYQCSKKY